MKGAAAIGEAAALGQARTGTRAIAAHWPEYLMEAAGLGLFMLSACAFTVLLEHPASPVHQALPLPWLRRFCIGMKCLYCRIGRTDLTVPPSPAISPPMKMLVPVLGE